MVPCPERRETQPVGPNARFEQRRPLRVLVPAESPEPDLVRGDECTGPFWDADAAETWEAQHGPWPAMEPSHRLSYRQTPARKGSSSQAPTTRLIARPSEVFGNEVLA